MPRKAIIGIDLGTTNTTCYVLTIDDEGETSGEQLDIEHVSFRSRDEHPLRVDKVLPSCVIVSEKSNDVFCGHIVPECTDPDYYPVRNIKTKMGDDRWKVRAGDEYLTPVGVSAVILRTVYLSIEKYVGEKEITEIESVTITIPASFSSKMRRATKDAAKLAGFENVSLLDEPVAAIMSGYDIEREEFRDYVHTDRELLVFDMGGGTTDVTIMRINRNERKIEIIGSSRYNELGGADLDLEIGALILTHINTNESLCGRIKQMDSTAARVFASKLLEKAGNIKQTLDEELRALPTDQYEDLENSELVRSGGQTVSIADLFAGENSINIPNREIINAIDPYILRSSEGLKRNIFKPLHEVLDPNNEHNFIAIDKRNYYYYLVGGSCKFALVERELEKNLSPIYKNLDPTFAISIGATYSFYLQKHRGWRIFQRTTERVFIRRDGKSLLEILDRNLPIPCERRQPRKPLVGMDTIIWKKGTDKIDIEFYQGISKDDPNRSILYKTSLPLKQILIFDARLVSINGRIDESKVFHFEVQIKENDFDVFNGEISFDDASYSVNSTDQHDVNNLF